MNRTVEISKILEGHEEFETVLKRLIDDLVFLEGQLQRLRTLPFIRVNPKNPAEQKVTPASKQYKELLQQYNNCVKIICGAIGKSAEAEDSPLRAFFKNENLSCG